MNLTPFTLPIVTHLFDSFTTYLELFSDTELTDVLPYFQYVQHLLLIYEYTLQVQTVRKTMH